MLRPFCTACAAQAPLLDALRDGLASDQEALKVFSAHDTSLMPLLVALGVDDGAWAPYASAVVLERWRDPAPPRPRTYVRLAYQGRVLRVCDDLLCPLETFLATTDWVTRRDCALPTLALETDADGRGVLDAPNIANAASFVAGLLVAGLVARARCRESDPPRAGPPALHPGKEPALA